MGLSEFFQLSETRTGTHSWTLVSHDVVTSPPEALANALAEQIVEFQCRGCLHHYQAWKAHVEGVASLADSSRDALKAFFKTVVGLPENPDAVPLDHLEGFVAQLLWYFLSLETPSQEIVRAEPPGFKVTDPGGDGLIVHRMPAGYLMFRLWEIKKCTGSSKVTSTVNTAYGQLSAQATEYLARYTTIGQELADPELKEFYGKLIELWLDASPEASAGVSVTTSKDHVPQRCFTTFGNRFHRFVEPVRLRGMITAISDFHAFALQVRDYIWTGL